MLANAEKTKLAILFPRSQAAPAPVAPAPAPAPAPMQPAMMPVPQQAEQADTATDIAGGEDEQLERQQAVRGVIQELRQLIVLIAHHIWQMKLTEDQVSTLADRMIYQIADEINEITVDRVKELANDLLLGVEEKATKYRKRR
jgi:hypothetical protein